MKLKQLGFSLIELVIGIAVLSLISVAVGTSFLNIFSNQQNASNKSDIIGIDSAFKSFLLTDAFCSSSLKGLSINNSTKPLVIKGFQGFGSNGGDLKNGTALNDKITLAFSTIKYNTSQSPIETYHNGSKAMARLVDISYSLKSKKAFAKDSEMGSDKSWMQSKAQSVTIPVKIQGGAIVSCDSANSPESICAATGGTWANNKCEPNESCVFKGNFISWSCTGVRKSYSCGNNLADQLTSRANNAISGIYTVSILGSKNTKLIKRASNGGVTNPQTGSLNCPSDSTKTFTGRDTNTYTLDCGKKCTYKINQTTEFYSCRKCSGD